VDDRVQGVDARRPLEQPSSRQELIHRHPEREDVGASVDFLSERLFRGHVGGRSRRHPRLGPVRVRDRLIAVIRNAREAEVENFHPRVSGDEDVLRLQIAMKDAAGVRGSQAARDLDGVVEPRGDRRRVRHPIAQGLPVEAFGDDERASVLESSVVHRDDVRVVECGQRAELDLETPPSTRVVGVRRRKDL
jgi:hypothetical protein